MDHQIDAQALDVLNFVQRNVQTRALIHDLVCGDIARWTQLGTKEKATVLERNVRRFRAVCPTLAGKDRVAHAIEALRWAAAQESATEPSFAFGAGGVKNSLSALSN